MKGEPSITALHVPCLILGFKDVELAHARGRRGRAMLKILISEISLVEKVLRSVVVCPFLLLAFRLTGKRQVGQLTAFDLIVLLIVSPVVQNAVIGNDAPHLA